MRRITLVTVGLLYATIDAGAQTPRDLVARGVAAMGGEAALRGLSTLTLDFNTATFGIGQEETPASPARATLASGRIVTDLAGNRRVLTHELRPVAGNPQRQRRVTAGGIGLLETDGRMAPDGAPAVATAERAMRLSPDRLLLSALTQPAALAALPRKEWRGYQNDGVRYSAGPDTLSLYFDRASGLLTVVEVVADDPILGDRQTATWYTRWQPAGPVKFPRQVDVEVNGRLQSHTVYTAVSTDGAADQSAFAIPDSIASKAPRAAPGPERLRAELATVAPGVWHVTGGTHHSLVVEQADHLIVIETPFSTARSRAVLDTLKARFPAKPVRTIVVTHHHWDHSSGVRGYLASGVPSVVTHSRSADFIRQIAAAPKRVSPDELSRAPKVPDVRTVDDSLVIGSGAGRVVLYHTPTVHVEGMLMAYVPSARLLFNSDLVGPGPVIPAAGAAELVAAVRQRRITVDLVAGGHGGAPAKWADVERAAGM